MTRGSALAGIRFTGELMLALLASSCGRRGIPGAGAAAHYRPSSRSAVEELYEGVRFGNPDLARTPGGSARFLGKIHGWLVEGIGLRRLHVDSYELLVLRPIPAPVLAEITAAAFSDSFDSGYLLLQARFWREVARLQRERRLRVALIEKGPDSIVGVTIENPRLIAFSVIADSGTFRHELRHVRQYEILSRHRAPALVLSESCLGQASRFFAELDATTVQLAAWKKVFLDLPSAPVSPSRAESDFPRVPSVVLRFLWNLRYPEEAYGWTARSGCPDELMEIDRWITASTHHFISLNDPRSGFNEASDFGILSAEGGAAGMTDRAWKARRAFSETIDSEIAARPRAIRALLSRLSPGIQHDLCHNAMGYELMTDCSAYFQPRKE